MKLIGFAGGSYSDQSIVVAGERTINLYPSLIETPAAKNQYALYPTPGLSLVASVATGKPCRGIISVNNRVFVVFGGDFYEIFQDPTISPKLRGTILSGFRPVSMESSGTQVMIVSEPQGYIFDLASGAFDTIMGDFPGAVQCGFADGYFLAVAPRSRKLYISGLYDGLNWDALDYGLKEGDPGDIVSLLTDHGEVWLFGNRKAEGFYNSGNADFPFERIPSARIEQGCIAPWSPVRIDNSLMWLGGDERGAGIIWRASGYTPVRVSNHAIEHRIQSYGNMSDAIGFAYQDRGHSFYVLNFPAPDTTLVYDCATGMIHERGSWNAVNGMWRRHRAQFHCYAWDQHLVGDWETGAVYAMSIDYGSDNGDPIRRVRRGGHLWGENRRIFVPGFELHLEPGLGATDGQGSDPKVCFRYSWTGGKTWSNERTASAGKVGEYKRRVRFLRCGSGRDWVPECSFTDPTPFRIVDASVIDPSSGTS